MKKLIIANIKMNLISLAEREQYLQLLGKELKNKKFENAEIVLCPPFVHLESFINWKNSARGGSALGGKNVSFGVQNIFSETKGSYTGEISPLMIKSLGGKYVIVGHSERRRYFAENDHEINLKILAALKNGLKPILCVGETWEQKAREASVIAEQLQNCLAEVSRGKIENVVICYEPVWAISSNKPDHLPTADEIMTAKLLIKKFLAGKYGLKIAEKVTIIYGGSVAANNVQETCVDSGMVGALVGRESLNPREFIKIVEIINNSRIES